ncbi:MAG: adenosylcobinamide-phosphate synthase CbiB, partial [Promethearchaeota archaeon]
MNFLIYSKYLLIIPPLILIIALMFDLTIGDPEIKYHPVQLIGKTINKLKKILWTGKSKRDKLSGFLLIIITFLLFGSITYLTQILLWHFLFKFRNNMMWELIMVILYSIINGLILKWSFAIKYLGTVTKPIYQSLIKEDINDARKRLSYIVRRDTEELNEMYIISACVEVIAESSTDSAISVIWFYVFGNLIGISIYLFLSPTFLWLFLGIPSAYLFRIINTADSIVGYKDAENINIGYASAKLDDFSNYLPTRITVFFLLFISIFYGLDVKNGWRILKLDKNKTESVNAGWTMSTMAGLLNIQLEKKNHYKLGISTRELVP